MTFEPLKERDFITKCLVSLFIGLPQPDDLDGHHLRTPVCHPGPEDFRASTTTDHTLSRILNPVDNNQVFLDPVLPNRLPRLPVSFVVEWHLALMMMMIMTIVVIIIIAILVLVHVESLLSRWELAVGPRCWAGLANDFIVFIIIVAVTILVR
jgi:hypothetical protein